MKTTIGMRSAATARITPKPSITGICTSRNTSSGASLLDGGDGLRAVGALADHLDVGLLRQQRQHPLPRHRLVVHDQRSDLRHLSLHRRRGGRARPCQRRTSKRSFGWTD